MNAIFWGVLFIVVGLIVATSGLLGYLLAWPFVWLGFVLVGAGALMGIWHFVAVRRRGGREPRRGGPIV